MTLKTKLVIGGAYLAGTNVLGQVFAIIINIVLARLLHPEDFGVIALSGTYIGFISLFSAVGFGSAVIYYKELDQRQTSSIYWMNFLFSVVTFLVIVLTAPLAAGFYNTPSLTGIVRWSALGILVSPFFMINYKLLERNLEFKLLAILNLSSTIIGSLLGVLAAFLHFGVYALVVQSLSSIVIKMFLILYHSSWRPLFYFNWVDIKSPIWYSVKFKASNSVLYVERNIDYLILGKIFRPQQLGYYSFAYNIMYTPVKRISYIFSNMLFPALSSLKNDNSRLLSTYFRSSQLIAIVAFPMMTLLALNADWLIPTVFGEQWGDAVPVIKILSFAGAIQSVGQLGAIVFPSIGKPEISVYLSIIRSMFTILAILGGSHYGLIGVAYALIFAKALSLIVTFIFVYRFLPFDIFDLVKIFVGPITNMVILFVVYNALSSSQMSISGGMAQFVLMSIISLGISLLFHKSIIMDIVKVLFNRTILKEH